MYFLIVLKLSVFQILQTTPKEDQKTIIRKLKEEQRRKMALLGEQYEQTIADMLQKQSVSFLYFFLEFFVGSG